jgi:hypothetical protein
MCGRRREADFRGVRRGGIVSQRHLYTPTNGLSVHDSVARHETNSFKIGSSWILDRG